MMRQGEEFEEKLMHDNPGIIEVLLSKERTLLSRERTAIALGQLALSVAVFGFIVLRFFTGGPSEEWFIFVGAGAVVLAGYLTFHAWRDYGHFKKELENLHRKRGHLDSVYVEGLE